MAWAISGSRQRKPSTRAGETLSPPESTMMSFLRSVICEIAVAVDDADIAGVQPAVAQRGGGPFGIAPIALHHRLAAHEDLAVLGDPHLDARERRADGVQLHLAGRVDADDRRGLGLAVALQQAHAEGGEEEADLEVERGAAGDQGLEPAAEALRAPCRAPAARPAGRAAARLATGRAAAHSACGRAPRRDRTGGGAAPSSCRPSA